MSSNLLFSNGSVSIFRQQALISTSDNKSPYGCVASYAIDYQSLVLDELILGNEIKYNIDGLVQERRNSSALAMELHLSCTN